MADLIIRINALDHASEALKQMKTHLDGIGESADKASNPFDKLGESIQKVSAIGFTLFGLEHVLSAVHAAVEGLLGPMLEQLRVNAQTDAVLKSTAGSAGMTRQAVDELADSLQTETGQSNETVQSTENLLLTFTNIKDNVFPQATELALDMAQALGEDTKSAAIQLGKALQDPITGATALRRIGVQLTQAQQEQIKVFVESGDVLSAQKIILNELNNEVGGSAKAFGNSLPGQIKIAMNAFEDFRKNLLMGAEPALNALMHKITEFATSTDFQGWAKEVGTYIGVLVENFVGLAEVVGTVFSSMLDVIVSVGRLIYEALSYINPFARHSPSLVESVQTGVDAINSSFGGLVDTMPIIDKLGGKFEDLKDTIKATVDDAKDRLGELKQAISDLKDKLNDLENRPVGDEGALESKKAEVMQNELKIEQEKQRQMEVYGKLLPHWTFEGQKQYDISKSQLDTMQKQHDIAALKAKIDSGPQIQAIKDQIKLQEQQAKDEQKAIELADKAAQKAQEEASKEKAAHKGGGGGGGGISTPDLPGKGIAGTFENVSSSLVDARAKLAGFTEGVHDFENKLNTIAVVIHKLGDMFQALLAGDANSFFKAMSEGAQNIEGGVVPGTTLDRMRDFTNLIFGQVIPAVQNLGKFINDHKELWVGLAAALLVAAVAGAGISVALSTVSLVVLGIAAVVGIVTAAWIGNWGDIQGKTQAVVEWIENTAWPVIQRIFNENILPLIQFFGAVWGAIWPTAQAILTTVWTYISTDFWPNIQKLFGDVIKYFQDLIKGDWQAVWDDSLRIVKDVWNLIAGVIGADINVIIDLINGFVDGINDLLAKIPAGIPGSGSHISHIGHIDIPRLDTGGMVLQTGLAIVDKGERFSGVGNGRNAGGDVHVHLEGSNIYGIDELNERIYEGVVEARDRGRFSTVFAPANP